MTLVRPRVELTIRDGVAQVVLSRPEKRNALDRLMFEAIADVIAELGAMTDLRCVVLSGAGPCFCAGIDTKAIAETVGSPSDLLPRTHGPTNIFQHAAWGWHALPVPVIAAVHGVAFGGGLQIALGADIRIVAPDARLSVMEIRYGLVPDMAGIERLAALCRDDRMRELVYTGRELDGPTAVEYGLATSVAPDPLAEATRMAHAIARSSSAAIRAGKRLCNIARDAEAEDVLQEEAAEQATLLASSSIRMK